MKFSSAEAVEWTQVNAVAIGTALALATLTWYALTRKQSKTKFLDKSRQQLTLSQRVNISHDVVRFRFALPKSAPVLGLPIGKHFKVFAPKQLGKVPGEWNGKPDPEQEGDENERKYTPTTSDDEIGYVDLVIKVYKGGHERFSDGGKMSQFMDSLKVGNQIDVSGPWGTKEYLGHGKMKSGPKVLEFKKVGMMAGGTGITPMLQIMAAILKDPTDKTEISLLYANQTESDILVRDMLEDLAKKHPQQLKLWYTLDHAPPSWRYSTGFINKEMISTHLPGPDEACAILMCGPPPMVKYACEANLEELGYSKDKMVAF